ncbi:MAG: hypothetical protein RL264_1802 [Bacteroidota bacterium]
MTIIVQRVMMNMALVEKTISKMNIMKDVLIFNFVLFVFSSFSQISEDKKSDSLFINKKGGKNNNKEIKAENSIDSSSIYKAEISKLKNEIKNKEQIINFFTSKNNALKDSLNYSLSVINEINTIWLKDMFVKKFMDNSDYFTTKDLAKEDDRYKNRNYDLLAKSLIINKVTKDTLIICNQLLNFNKAYLTLYEIRENVLNQKYDSLKVDKAIKQINSIKDLDPTWQLSKTKQLYFDLLSNYRSNVQDLILELEKRKRNPEQKSDYSIKEYNKLESNPKFNRYPYLLKVIREMKNDVNSYTEDDL